MIEFGQHEDECEASWRGSEESDPDRTRSGHHALLLQSIMCVNAMQSSSLMHTDRAGSGP